VQSEGPRPEELELKKLDRTRFNQHHLTNSSRPLRHFNRERPTPNSKQNLKNSKIIHLNVRSLAGKVDMLDIFLSEAMPDVFIVTEHGLTQENLNSVKLNNYTLLASYCREENIMGGVAIYGNINSDIKNVKLGEISNRVNKDFVFEGTDLTLQLNGLRLLVGGIYRSPCSQNLKEFFEKLNIFLELANQTSDRLLIAGDFNIDSLSKDNSSKNFKNILSSYGLSLIINSPTRTTETTSTCIDNFITNINPVKGSVITPLISDHDAISANIPAYSKNKVKFIWVTKRMTKQKNLEELAIRLRHENWKETFRAKEVNDMYNSFLNTFLYHFNISCPIKRSKQYTSTQKSKWISEDIKLKKDVMFDRFRDYKNSKDITDKLNYKRAREDYRQEIINSKARWMEASLYNAENKSKQAWKIIDTFRKDKNKGSNNMKLELDGNMVNKPEIVCEAINTYFINIASKIRTDIVVTGRTSPPVVTATCDLNSFTPISKEQLQKVFSKFSAKSSCGFDDISMMVLKSCQQEIADPLLYIINNSLKEGVFPDQCKLAKIKPIFKKGVVTDVGNYRPISLLPAFSKIFERVVCDQLTFYLESNNLICNRQYGFRKNRSTKLALIDFVNQCIDALDAGESVIGCFADLSKAFDCVDAQILLKKLQNLSIGGRAFNWLASFLSNRRQYTEITHQTKFKLKTVSSKEQIIQSGVPQGSILGPVLFLVYVNDMPGMVPVENLFMFADDTTLFSKHRDAKSLEIQTFEQINNLAQYFSNNQLLLNSGKTGYLCIQTHQRANSTSALESNVFIGEDRLNPADSVDFLGVKLDGCLTWSDHIEKLEKKLSSGLFVLRRTSKLKNCNLSRLVYLSLMESHITYSIALWGGFKTHLEKVFVMQKKAVRAIYGLPPWGHCGDLFLDLGILTVPCLYVFETIMYVKSQNLTTHGQRIHDHNTRHKSHFSEYHRLALFQKKPLYIGLKYLQSMPKFVTEIVIIKKFRSALKNYLLNHNFYDVDSLIEHSKTCDPSCHYLNRTNIN
jgi:hypothetical protein